jgi:hypothetical protein
MSTPYDLRFNLIHFAREQLSAEYQAALEKIMLSYPETSEEKTKLISSLKYPTKSDIINLAEEIKNFVDKK